MLEVPLVRHKNHEDPFNPTLIIDSLIEETEICRLVAWLVTYMAVRKIISMGLKIVTAPLIREIVCTELLLWGLEKQRLQYTRIGFPKYDLDNILQDKIYLYPQIITQHVIQENEAVDKLIEEVDSD